MNDRLRRFRFDPTTPDATLGACEEAIASLGVPELDAATLAATPPSVLFDVRSAAEFAVGRISGAVRVDPGASAAAIRRAAGAGAVVAYCAVGLRSARLVAALVEAGVPARNLRGGIFRWARDGRAMVDDRGPTLRVHPFDARWGRLLAPDR